MIKIVSFNLRCVWDGDGINGFVYRAGSIYDKIIREMPDIIGFQEVIPRQRKWMECIYPIIIRFTHYIMKQPITFKKYKLY